MRRAHSGRIDEAKRMRVPSAAAPRSRIFTRATATGPIPVCDRTLGAVTMPHKTVPPVGKLQMLHACKENFSLQLDRARKKSPGSSRKNIGQWIVDLTGLTKANNVDSLVHGVSLSLRGSGRPTPASIRRTPQTVIPSFPHSSRKWKAAQQSAKLSLNSEIAASTDSCADSGAT